MTKKSNADAFGTNTTQSASLFTIDKAILVTQGLIANTANTAQTVMNSLCKHWSTVFTNANRVTNTDETVIVSYDGQTTRTEGSNVYRVDTYRIQYFKLTPPSDPNPNDY